eukprot:545089_1
MKLINLCLMAIIAMAYCLRANGAIVAPIEKSPINDGETDITYDEKFEHLDVMGQVDIALSSFVCWNLFSIFAGMFICCFIQTGHYHFTKHEDISPSKQTPY